MATLTGSENLVARFYIEGVYVTGGNGTANAAGPNGSIQFNSNGNFAGTSNLVYSDANGGTLTTGAIVANAIITPVGNLAIANLVSNGTITGNVITANTANLVDLTVTGNANLGDVANLTILGGSNGQVLTTDGNGDLSWTTVNANTDRITSADGYSLIIADSGVMTATTQKAQQT